MTQTYKISQKQSLIDACIQVYGTAQLLFTFAKDNGLNIDSVVSIGDELVYDEALGIPRVKNIITRKGLNVGNEGDEDISTAIVFGSSGLISFGSSGIITF